MRVDVDQIPSLGRPAEVDRLVDETSALRDKLRAANEQLASAEQKLEQAEHDDAQAASERLRKGATLGAEAPNVEKARKVVEQARRAERAVTLAVGAALTDLGSTMEASSTGWLDELERLADEARERGRQALDELERSLADLATASSAAAWVRSGQADGRWDRRPPMTPVGAYAPTSARLSPNGQPFDRAAVLAWASELVAAPTPAPVAVVEPASDAAA